MATTEVMRYTYHINSAQRSLGSNTDFTVNFSQIVNLLSKGGVFQVIVSNVQIPFTFYQLSSTSNLNQLPVYIKNPVDGAGINTTITLQPGNYTPYSLITELTSKLTTACGGCPTPFTPTFSMSYSQTNGYLTFGLSTPVGANINLLFGSSTVSQLLGRFFGVIANVYMVGGQATPPTSTQPCVLNPVNYLLIRSNLKQFRNREFITRPDDVSDILYKIPITTSQGTWVSYYQESEPVYILDSMIPSINFYLTNNLTYDPINLQNIPWSFSFTIKEVVRPTYDSINSTLVLNKEPAVVSSEEQLQELEKKKNDLLRKLEIYQRKLLRRGKLPSPLEGEEGEK